MPRIVLVNSEIPPNSGNIARNCAATRTELDLVGPLGFELSDRYLKRAGLDYWPYVNLKVHDSIDQFWQHQHQLGGRLLGFTTSGASNYIDIEYHDSDWLLFGAETTGLSRSVLDACQNTVKITMTQPAVRSLNLSVSVSVALFETLRQLKR